ncbi:peptidoglycan DD-metalloendopeptidase family protein [Flavihumibacter rivuli]|uniref:murein hydrolase activator EnvC family protein n=1 Tax=Flavihumibacter rivuli TaxID=2838156 RepID=UPI001BDF31AD|nr:peptidoglycan DD-metalloendopeptidase family protein [Flavihumibacter rivuli]ULQ54940.1 peptidoglycan DD-metalloendopeptidase family protein [Flavihumibacter rivuli]
MIKKILLFTLICFSVLGGYAQNQSSAELKRRQADIQREIDELRKQLEQTTKYKRKSLGELNLIQKKIRLREQQIRNINDQINLIQSSINASWRDIVKLRAELDTLKLQYEKSVVYAYMNRSNYDFLNFIFSAGTFNDALKRVAYLKSYRAYREQQASVIRNTQQMLEQKIKGLNLSKKEKSLVLQEQNKQFAVLQDERKEKDKVVSKIKQEERELMKDLTQKRKQDASLRSAINAAIRREIEAERRRVAALEKERREKEAAEKKANANAPKKDDAATTKTTTTTTKPQPKEQKELQIFGSDEVRLISDNFEKNRGSLPWPVNAGRVVMKFGPHSYEGLTIVYDNPGITIEAEAGSSIKAVFDGEVAAVTSVGPVQCVIVRHGKYFTSYSNLSSVSVSKGQQVKTGQVVGRLYEKDGGRGELEFLITNEKSVNLNPEAWLR